ncbi:uncharacterized protein PG986_006864 [Apiospora aurea]|uniref:Uncharacterized protein n=1 Tax=Apiospora aurea TaxID=335848 RepID=A0ABR1QBL6_9PEZI
MSFASTNLHEKDNNQGSGSLLPSGAAATPTQHTQYRRVTTKISKCDMCNQPNSSTIQKCMQCGFTTCSTCHAQGRYEPRHNLAGLALDWTPPPRGGRGHGRGRGRSNAAPVRDSPRPSGLIRQYAAENQQDDGSVERTSGGRPSAANNTAAPAVPAAAPAPAVSTVPTVPTAPAAPVVGPAVGPVALAVPAVPAVPAPATAATVAKRTPLPTLAARKREYKPSSLSRSITSMPSYMANHTSAAPKESKAPVAPMTVEPVSLAAAAAAATAVPEAVSGDKDEDTVMADVTTAAPATAATTTPAPAPADNSGSGAVFPPRAASTSIQTELFNIMLGEWTGGATADVRREHGPLDALERLEMATSLIAMSRGVPFPPQCEAWIRRQRRYFRIE